MSASLLAKPLNGSLTVSVMMSSPAVFHDVLSLFMSTTGFKKSRFQKLRSNVVMHGTKPYAKPVHLNVLLDPLHGNQSVKTIMANGTVDKKLPVMLSCEVTMNQSTSSLLKLDSLLQYLKVRQIAYSVLTTFKVLSDFSPM